jgi:hypothetical protein
LSLAACGGDGGNGGNGVTHVTNVTVTVNDPVRMGQTTQATGTATLSDGQTRAVTSGFRSDATGVATVTDSGMVAAVGNGQATIYAVYEGIQGQDLIRVVPDYHGTWTGGLRVTACAQSGAWATAKMCDEFSVNSTTWYWLSLDQSGDSMSARLDRGSPLNFPAVTAALNSDGSASFKATVTVTDSAFTATLDATFAIQSARVGDLTGTVTEVWRAPNITGELRLAENIVNTTRISTTPSMADTGESSPAFRVLQRLPH